MPQLTKEQLQQFFDERFPQGSSVIERVAPMEATVRHVTDERSLRPGNTISGPAQMAVADAAMYAALLAEIGPVALAVTTSFNINFMRKPDAGSALLADCRILKLGKRLAVGEVWIRTGSSEEPVAHATVTYSIPPPEHRG